MAQLEWSVAGRAAAALLRAAHALKGLLGNFTADRAFQTASRLEAIGLDGKLAGAEELHAALVGEIDALTLALTASVAESRAEA